jgi:ankyrin repeat protein
MMIERTGYEPKLIYYRKGEKTSLSVIQEISQYLDNERQKAMNNLLSQACWVGAFDLIEYALKNGANPNCYLDANGAYGISACNPVFMAVNNGQLEVLDKLLPLIKLSEYIEGIVYWAAKNKQPSVFEWVEKQGYEMSDYAN